MCERESELIKYFVHHPLDFLSTCINYSHANIHNHGSTSSASLDPDPVSHFYAAPSQLLKDVVYAFQTFWQWPMTVDELCCDEMYWSMRQGRNLMAFSRALQTWDWFFGRIWRLPLLGAAVYVFVLNLVVPGLQWSRIKHWYATT